MEIVGDVPNGQGIKVDHGSSSLELQECTFGDTVYIPLIPVL